MASVTKFVDRLEQTIIGGLLAAMTLLAAGQALLRELFFVSSTWALEVLTVMFAWLILFGMSYGIKTGTHLGVDAFVKLFPERLHRAFAIFAALCCVLYAAILFDATWLKALFGDAVNARGGALTYVQKMYAIGLELENVSLPRWIAYLILPVGLALLAFRSLQAIWQIVLGQRDSLIAGHEAEDLIASQENASASASSSQSSRD